MHSFFCTDDAPFCRLFTVFAGISKPVAHLSVLYPARGRPSLAPSIATLISYILYCVTRRLMLTSSVIHQVCATQRLVPTLVSLHSANLMTIKSEKRL